MVSTLTVSSTQSDRKLVFSNFNGENFDLDLTGTVQCSVSVYGYAPHSENISEWFKQLTAERKPWQGDMRWSSLETEFEISANCTSLGQVCFEVNLWLNVGAEEESQIKTFIVSELGQLEKIGREANIFSCAPIPLALYRLSRWRRN